MAARGSRRVPPEGERTVPRPRLFRALDAARRRRVVWLGAAPGAGETTLLTDYLAARSLPSWWLSVHAGHADPAAFYLDLARALGGEPLPVLTREHALGLETFGVRFFEELGRRLSEPTVLVLDNYETIAATSPVHVTLAAAGEALPPLLTLALLSRGDPPTVFARLRANERMAVLDPSALAMTDAEAHRLARLRRGAAIPDGLGARLNRVAEGWCAGLALLLETDSIPAPGVVSSKGRELFFDYFAVEVFERSPPELRALMLRTAIAPDVSEALAEALTGRADAGAMMRALARRLLFVTASGALVRYRYHALFRDFLRARAHADLGLEEVHRLEAIAAARARRGRSDRRGGRAHGVGGSRRGAVLPRALPRAGDDRAGTARGAARLARATATRARRGRPMDRLLDGRRGGGARPRGRAPRARGRLRALHGSLRPRGGLSDGRGDLRVVRSRPGLLRAPRPVARRDRAAPRARLPVGRDRAAVRAGVRDGCGAPAPGQPADRGVDRGHEGVGRRHPRSQPPRAGGGAADAAPRLGRRRRVGARGHGSAPRLVRADRGALARDPGHPLALVRDGGVDRALTCVDRALAIGAHHGVRVWDSTVAENACYALLGAGDLERAQAYLDRYPDPFPQRTANRSQSVHLRGLLQLRRGELSAARASFELATELGVVAGAPFFDTHIQGSWAQLALAEGDRARAREHARRLRQGAERYGYAMFSAEALLVEASCDLYDPRAPEWIREGLRILERGGLTLPPWWDDAGRSALCARALELDIAPAFVRDLVRRHRLAERPPATASEGWPWRVRLYTLGRLEIVVDDRPVELGRKAPARLLALLGDLIASAPAGLSADDIAADLYPEQDGDAAAAALKTAIARLRKLLVPDAILVRAGRVMLDPSLVWIDALELRDRIASGREPLEAIGRLYRGELLPAADVPRVGRARRALARQVAGARLTAAAGALESGAFAAAVEHAERALEVDPTSEDAYRALMRAHAGRGERAAIERAYASCCRRLDELEGTTPSEQTRALFAQLTT